jgi:hypothetical protein
VGEQAAPDAASFVARCDEELIDDESVVRVTPERDVAGSGALVSCHEDDVASEHVEHLRIVPAGEVAERGLCEAKELLRVGRARRTDLNSDLHDL